MILTTILAILINSGEPDQTAPFESIFPDKKPPVQVSVLGKGKVRYEAPSFAQIKSAAFNAKTGRLIVKLRGSIPKGDLGYMSVEVYFNDAKGKDYFAAMPLGTAKYKPAGEAWAFGNQSWRPARKLASKTGADWIEFRELTKVAQGQELFMVMIRYLPNSIDIQNVSRGTNDIVTEIWMEKITTRNGGFIQPNGPPLKRL